MALSHIIPSFSISRMLKPRQLEDYARGLFQYKEIQIKSFDKWADKRKYHQQKHSRSVAAEIEAAKKKHDEMQQSNVAEAG